MSSSCARSPRARRAAALRPSRRWRSSGAALVALLACAACRRDPLPPTGLVVEISSNLGVPGELDEVRLVATSTTAAATVLYERSFPLGSGESLQQLPFKVALVPQGIGDAPFRIEARGLKGGMAQVSRSATLSFLREQVLFLPLPLLDVCRGVACGVASQTCKESGNCEDNAAGGLRRYSPGITADAGMATDGRAPDGAGPAPDVPPPDGPAPDVGLIFDAGGAPDGPPRDGPAPDGPPRDGPAPRDGPFTPYCSVFPGSAARYCEDFDRHGGALEAAWTQFAAGGTVSLTPAQWISVPYALQLAVAPGGAKNVAIRRGISNVVSAVPPTVALAFNAKISAGCHNWSADARHSLAELTVVDAASGWLFSGAIYVGQFRLEVRTVRRSANWAPASQTFVVAGTMPLIYDTWAEVTLEIEGGKVLATVDGNPSVTGANFVGLLPTRMDSAYVELSFNFDGNINGTPGFNWGSNCTVLYDNVRFLAP